MAGQRRELFGWMRSWGLNTYLYAPKDDLKHRIEAAAKFVPLENLCLSPQCGFSSTHHGNKLTLDDQRRKLVLALEVAQEVWGTT